MLMYTATAQDYGTTFLGRLPLTMALREASDAGMPIVPGDNQEDITRVFDNLVSEVSAFSGNQVQPIP